MCSVCERIINKKKDGQCLPNNYCHLPFCFYYSFFIDYCGISLTTTTLETLIFIYVFVGGGEGGEE